MERRHQSFIKASLLTKPHPRLSKGEEPFFNSLKSFKELKTLLPLLFRN
jgi:hypothetical protein